MSMSVASRTPERPERPSLTTRASLSAAVPARSSRVAVADGGSAAVSDGYSLRDEGRVWSVGCSSVGQRSVQVCRV